MKPPAGAGVRTLPTASAPEPARRRAPRARRRTRVIVAGLLLLVAGSGGAPPPAAAQIPVIDAAHIALNSYWHYVHYLQFALQIYHQIQQLEYQIQMLRKLANPNWRDIQQLLTDLDALVRSGRSIGYALDNAGGQLRQVFPGWTPFQDPTVAPLQSERAIDTMRAGLAAISRQSQSFAPGEQTLAAIRQQMATTGGTQQALEQITTLESFSAQEQLLTRQSLAVNANLQAVANAYWIDREAQARATFQLVNTETGLAAYQSTSPGWTFVPAGSWP
jgi:P-type conjugative transfer protein TrbJ